MRSTSPSWLSVWTSGVGIRPDPAQRPDDPSAAGRARAPGVRRPGADHPRGHAPVEKIMRHVDGVAILFYRQLRENNTGRNQVGTSCGPSSTSPPAVILAHPR